MTHRKKKQLLTVVVVTVGVAALLAAATWQGRQQHAGYTRYVSPALRGGTRFTFLYPNRPTETDLMWHSGGQWTEERGVCDSGSVFVVKKQNRVDQALRRFAPYRKAFPPDNECINVQFGERPAKPPAWAGAEDRRGSFFARSGGYIHDASVTQAGTGRDFDLEYTVSARTPEFDAHDRVFIASFQVLPPGASVPK